MTTSTNEATHEIVQTRTFDAPRDLVFNAFTNPEHVAHWWGPNGYTITNHEMDVKVGGVWRFTMHGPNGKDFPNKVVYTEIVPAERLVYDHGDFETTYFQVIVTFEDQGGKTALTMRSLFPTAEARAEVVAFGAIELGQQTLAKLAEHLASA